MTCCPTCGRQMPEKRLGVQLTQLKARIFDAVKRASTTGITSEDLFAIVFADRDDITINTLKAHVQQINEAIEGTGFRIVSRDRRWVLTKVQLELSL
jgi:hypothetical protein